MRAIFTITTLFLPLFIFGQMMQTAWEKTYGESGDESIRQIMQASNGYVFAAGQTASKTAGGKDGLLLIADFSTGNLIATKKPGGTKDDMLNAVVQLPQGQFLLAGSTESFGAPDRDAWLVLTDDRGEIIWQQNSGAKGDDSWEKACLLPDGAVALAGYKDGGIRIARLRGKVLEKEATIGKSDYETISGLAGTPEGQFVLTGNTKKSSKQGSGDIYLAKTDPDGKVLWERFFGEKDWEESLGLCTTADGGYAIAGLTRSKGAGDLDMWLIKVSRDGFQQWEKTFGGKDADIAAAVAQTPDGGFLLAGHSRSQRTGQRQFKGFLVKTDGGGFRQWEQYFGGDSEDIFQTATILYDGNALVGGSTASKGAGGTDGWIVGLSDPLTAQNAYAGARDQAKIECSAGKLATDDGLLRPSENSYLTVTVSNNNSFDLPDVKLQMEQKNSTTDLSAWATNYVGALKAGESRAVFIPVGSGAALKTGAAEFHLTAFSGAKNMGSTPVTIQTKEPVAAAFEIAGFQYIPSKTSDEITLQVKVENPGDFPTGMATAKFECPAGWTAADASVQPLGALLPRSSKDLRFKFLKSKTSTAGGLVFSIAENNKEKIKKTLEMGAPGARPLAGGPILIWTDPAPHELGTNRINRNQDNFEFKMTVVAGSALQPKDFKLRVNGIEMEGSKFNEEDLSAPTREQQQFTYTYKNKLPLKRGKNTLEVLVDGQVSEPLDVIFEPRRANLHLLTIGPSHPDLKFTSKDAADFAAAFQEQGGAEKLFANVYTRQYVLPETTTLTGIQQAMYDLVYQYKDNLISPDDVLMVFISSHGKITGNRFKILQSNYNPKYEQIALDFKNDIIENLNQIDCKKLIFLDACHSGAARARSDNAGLSQALIDLAKSQPGIATLTSCRSNELSYEDAAWENGAFTEAILEAFSGKTVTDDHGTYRADADDDKILRLGELYDFLKKRVPSMVKSQLPSAPTEQEPFMPEEQLDRGLPIYFIR